MANKRYICPKCGERWGTNWAAELTPSFIDGCPNCFEFVLPDGHVATWREARAIVWDNSDGYCYHCGVAIHPIRDFEVDHLHPRSKGGDNEITNLVASCSRCNRSKGAKPVDEWEGPRV